MTTTTMPATVRELVEEAQAQGIQPSEYLERLMTPPAGFVQQEDAIQAGKLSNMYSGPTFEGDSWKITTYWEALEGLTFYLDGPKGNAISGTEAGKISAALAEVERLTA
ncbi:hypothetical protein [Pseudarthrobacter oxydans]|uniref:hypothetical protein n=1 Tax=Pseudarthrobacter oxydans TaxID=1671 RepID=UPI00344EAE11